VLEEELVRKRRVVSRDEFLTIYGIGRVVPSGTMTALAVAQTQQFLRQANKQRPMIVPPGPATQPQSRREK
jgi:chromate transport protein ChrA